MIKIPTLSDRSAGLLLHVTSLPGPNDVGDFGPSAYDFCRFLQRTNCRWWQLLPLNPIGNGNSPYATISSFAGEPLFISRDLLYRAGFLQDLPDTGRVSAKAQSVNYSRARQQSEQILREAGEMAWRKKFSASQDFSRFRRKNKFWLPDYCLFTLLAKRFRTTAWHTWPDAYKKRQKSVLEQFKRANRERIFYLEFQQYLFQQQWEKLRHFANKRGIGIIGDLPIFVSLGSADVWSHQELFWLKADGAPRYVAGCPPDAFNQNGQLWGSALYDWSAHRGERYQWWIERLRRAFQWYDAIRLDHFIGFCRYWRIGGAARTARNGRWIPGPGDKFFAEVFRNIPRGQFIAEDLGAVSQEVRALRDRWHLPGMKILQFAFDNDKESITHRLANVNANSVIYTGTHDNNTMLGWYKSLSKSPRRFANLLSNLKAVVDVDSRDLSWLFCSLALNSPAKVGILPLQDVVGLDGRHRMNVPGTSRGNWRWRASPAMFTNALEERLRHLNVFSGRAENL